MTAIECLANLIAPKNDEIEINQENDCFFQKIFSQTMHWPCGYYQPILTSPEIQLDLTDIEILEQDLIKCLYLFYKDI